MKTHAITSYGSGRRKNVVNRCLEFGLCLLMNVALCLSDGQSCESVCGLVLSLSPAAGCPVKLTVCFIKQ